MFHDKIKALRESKNATQQDMADYLGMTRQGYGRYESGKIEANYKNLTMLAEYFNVTTDYLLGVGEPSGLRRCSEEELNTFILDVHTWYKSDNENGKKLKLLKNIFTQIKNY